MPSFTDFFGDQSAHESLFSKKPFSAEKARAERKAKNAKAVEQAKRATPPRGRSEVKVNNGMVRFEPVLSGGRAFPIEGRAVNFVPLANFPAFVAYLNEQIDAGAFDEALAGDDSATSQGSAPDAPKRRGRRPKTKPAN